MSNYWILHNRPLCRSEYLIRGLHIFTKTTVSYIGTLTGPSHPRRSIRNCESSFLWRKPYESTNLPPQLTRGPVTLLSGYRDRVLLFVQQDSFESLLDSLFLRFKPDEVLNGFRPGWVRKRSTTKENSETRRPFVRTKVFRNCLKNICV